MIRTSRIYVSLLAVTLCLSACSKNDQPAEAVAEPEVDVVAELNQLYHEYDEEMLALNPITATFRGDHRFNDQWGPYDFLSDEYAEAMYDLHKRYLAKLLEYDPETLTGQDRLNFEIFQFDRENAIERQDQGYNDYESLTPVSQFFSVPNFLPILGSGAVGQPFETPQHYDDWIKRSSHFVRHVDLSIAKMREGVELGVVQPRILMEKALPQLAAQVVESPEQSAFYGPIARMPESFSDEDRERLTAAYEDHIMNTLIPAYAKLHDYIGNEYMQHTRETVGQLNSPGGKDYYAFMVRETTTTNYTPEEIHEIGKREAERIYAEMEKVKDEVGFEGTMAEFFVYLREDPQFHFKSEEEILQAYEDLRNEIDPKLPKLFGTLAEAPYVLKPVEPFRAQSMAAAQYFPGTPDGSRPGIFYINTYDLPARPKWFMESLSIHEANPGHHFQISVAQEVEDLPAFRRFGGYTAYVEGWGLYAESLGKELGMYTDPLQYFGSLFGDIWRANRLVVDTGMHALGWTREEAIEYMASNSPITDTDVVAEVERYIAIPSQALAYKIGQLKIRELRNRAEEALGDKFDVRAYHDLVLTNGSLPLFVLEAEVDRWIEKQKT
ncbi:MAG: DUF885 domain-containing protein [Woeseiaceae bacterium]